MASSLPLSLSLPLALDLGLGYLGPITTLTLVQLVKMPSLTTLAALTALFTTAFAVPTPDTEPNVNVNAVPFRINQVSRGKVLKNGPAQVAKTYAKFGKTIPANVDSAAKAQSSGTVVATPEEYDTEYLCPVQIGTPAQTLMMDFDTGSSDTYVVSACLISSHSLSLVA